MIVNSFVMHAPLPFHLLLLT